MHLLSKLTHDEGKLFAVGGSFQSSHSFTENNLTIDVKLLSKMVSGKVGPFGRLKANCTLNLATFHG